MSVNKQISLIYLIALVFFLASIVFYIQHPQLTFIGLPLAFLVIVIVFKISSNPKYKNKLSVRVDDNKVIEFDRKQINLETWNFNPAPWTNDPQKIKFAQLLLLSQYEDDSPTELSIYNETDTLEQLDLWEDYFIPAEFMVQYENHFKRKMPIATLMLDQLWKPEYTIEEFLNNCLEIQELPEEQTGTDHLLIAIEIASCVLLFFLVSFAVMFIYLSITQ